MQPFDTARPIDLRDPQDLKYRGEESELIIGHGNRIREFCTLHPGTTGEVQPLRVGGKVESLE